MRGFPFQKDPKEKEEDLPLSDEAMAELMRKSPGWGRDTVDVTTAEKVYTSDRLEHDLEKEGYDLATRAVDEEGNITYKKKDIAEQSRVIPRGSSMVDPSSV